MCVCVCVGGGVIGGSDYRLQVKMLLLQVTEFRILVTTDYRLKNGLTTGYENLNIGHYSLHTD